MKKTAVEKKKRKHIGKVGYYGGKLLSSYDAAFEYRQKILESKRFISCTDAMKELVDDAGNRVFADSTAEKHQWKLQRMFTQLEADNFKEPTKGEHYVMLYEILYGTKEIAFKVKSADGDEKVEVVNVDLDPTEKVIIIREMLKMGGHYAPEKSEHKFDLTRTEHIILELYKMEKAEKVKEFDDSKNRIKKHLRN